MAMILSSFYKSEGTRSPPDHPAVTQLLSAPPDTCSLWPSAWQPSLAASVTAYCNTKSRFAEVAPPGWPGAAQPRLAPADLRGHLDSEGGLLP